MTSPAPDPPADEAGPQRAADLARSVGAVLAHHARAADGQTAADAVEIQAITDAMVRLLIGAPLRSNGKLTITALAAEADLRRNKLTHKHTGLKDLFYALVKAHASRPEPVTDAELIRYRQQKEDLARVRAERDDLRTLTQQLARIVQVLEVENHCLKATTSELKQQLAARNGVANLASHRSSRP